MRSKTRNKISNPIGDPESADVVEGEGYKMSVSPELIAKAYREAVRRGKDTEALLQEALERGIAAIRYDEIRGDQIVTMLGLFRLMLQTMKELGSVVVTLQSEMAKASVLEQVRTMKELQKEVIDTTVITDTIAKYIRERMPEIERRLEEKVKAVEGSEVKTRSTSSGGVLETLVSYIMSDIVAGLRDDIIKYIEEKGYKDKMARIIADWATYYFREYAERRGGALE